MSSWLSEREQRLVAGAEAASAATPIPTQIVSNGEYLPPPQSATQKKVGRRESTNWLTCTASGWG